MRICLILLINAFQNDWERFASENEANIKTFLKFYKIIAIIDWLTYQLQLINW